MKEINKEFLSILGHLLLRANKFEKALTIYRALHETYPDCDDSRAGLCYALVMNGHFEDAYHHANFLEGVSSFNNRLVASFLKSKSLWNLGYKREARKTLFSYIEMKGMSS